VQFKHSMNGTSRFEREIGYTYNLRNIIRLHPEISLYISAVTCSKKINIILPKIFLRQRRTKNVCLFNLEKIVKF